MLYTPLTCKAMQIAYAAHHGQTDKGGLPYIFHPYHLAEQMEDEVSCCAALLHDVVEDTDVTMEELAREFPEDVIHVLQLLTHRAAVPYFDYVRRIKINPIAVKIKLADIAHNSDQSRCPNLTEEQRAYFRRKYETARSILLED
jgi:(p)ppGpp synthase/HD superfamily hydrolase